MHFGRWPVSSSPFSPPLGVGVGASAACAAACLPASAGGSGPAVQRQPRTWLGGARSGVIAGVCQRQRVWGSARGRTRSDRTCPRDPAVAFLSPHLIPGKYNTDGGCSPPRHAWPPAQLTTTAPRHRAVLFPPGLAAARSCCFLPFSDSLFATPTRGLTGEPPWPRKDRVILLPPIPFPCPQLLVLRRTLPRKEPFQSASHRHRHLPREKVAASVLCFTVSHGGAQHSPVPAVCPTFPGTGGITDLVSLLSRSNRA